MTFRFAFPVRDAAVERDDTPVTVVLPEWFRHLCIVSLRSHDTYRAWSGTPEQQEQARYDVARGITALMNEEVYGLTFNPEFQLNGDNLEWRPDTETAWIDLGKVVGDDGLDGLQGIAGQDGDPPFSTASASALPAGSQPTATIANDNLALGIPAAYDGEDGINGSAGSASPLAMDFDPIADNDRYCYAASRLAEDYANDLKKLLSLFSAANTTFVGNAKDFVDAATDTIEIGVNIDDLILDTVASATYNTTTTILNYLIDNVDNTAVIDIVKCYFYCALIRAYDADDSYENLDYHLPIEIGQSLYDIAASVVDGEIDVDFKGWLTTLDEASNTALAILICSYAVALQNVVVQKLGLSTSWDLNIKSYMANAEYFDDRDCVECDCTTTEEWNHTFNFLSGNQSWYTYNDEGVWENGVGWKSEQYDQPNYPQRVGIRFDIPNGDTTITLIKITYTRANNTTVTDGITFSLWESGSYHQIINEDFVKGTNKTVEVATSTALTDMIQVFMTAGISSDTDVFKITEIYIEGEGTDPWE